MTAGCGAVRRSSGSWRTAAVLVAALALWLISPMATGEATAQTITVSANPPTMTVNTAVAGSTPISVTNATTKYTVVTANKVDKITASLASALPAGVTLTLTLAAPTGATSAGPVTLTAAAQNLVTNIPKNTNQGLLTITYTLSSTLAAGVVSVSTKNVTLTVGP